MDYSEICRKLGCEYYTVWNFGYEGCESCKLQGESYYIGSIAEDCPYKKEIAKWEQLESNHHG